MAALWDTARCNLVKVDRRFRGACNSIIVALMVDALRKSEGAIYQKAAWDLQTKMNVFWVAVTCNLVEPCWRFRRACFLHHKDDKTSTNFYQTTRFNNSEGSHTHARRRENLKSRFVSDEDGDDKMKLVW
jgi:hypothetical protein